MMRVAIFTDEPVTAEGVAAVLGGQNGFEIVAVCPDPAELPRTIASQKPDLLLVDYHDNLAGGLMAHLRANTPGCRIVLWVRKIPIELAYQAIALGVRGILPKTAPVETLVRKLERIAAGELCVDESVATRIPALETVELTKREGQLLELVAQGMKNREMASALSITEGTVKVYLTRLFQKAGVRDRYQLALFGLRNLGLTAGEAGRSAPRRERATPWPKSLALSRATDAITSAEPGGPRSGAGCPTGL